MLSSFTSHLAATSISKLDEARDVFSMMRNRIVDAQVDNASSTKGMTPEKLDAIRGQMQDQLKDMPSNQIVQQYIQLTGKGDPVPQPEPEEQEKDQQ